MNPYSLSVLADEHIRGLHAAAEHRRLVAQALKRQPGLVRRTADRVRHARTATSAWTRRSQLGPQPNYCPAC
jgi:hypothetical protein